MRYDNDECDDSRWEPVFAGAPFKAWTKFDLTPEQRRVYELTSYTYDERFGFEGYPCDHTFRNKLAAKGFVRLCRNAVARFPQYRLTYVGIERLDYGYHKVVDVGIIRR
jgi:hypothetical protein